MVTAELLYIALGVLIGGLLLMVITRRRPGAGMDPLLLQLQRDLAERLDRLTSRVDARLSEGTRAIAESKSFLAERVTAAEQSVRSVSAGLGKLEQATGALQRTSEEITAFQRLLLNPTIRGSFGEIILHNLLESVLPAERYALQYTMPGTGEVADAVVHLQDGYVVAVDAKFPLSQYRLFAQARDEEAQRTSRREFLRDVKKHVLNVSRKYIVPAAKTLDYAFMYIPVEGVYYETMVRDEAGENLWDFCLQHRVVPVSPNSFLAYLQTVLVGLRGLRLEQQTKEILASLGQVRRDFTRFAQEFTTVGGHLINAKNRYDDSARHLDRFANRLEQLDIGAPPALPAERRQAAEARRRERASTAATPPAQYPG